MKKKKNPLGTDLSYGRLNPVYSKTRSFDNDDFNSTFSNVLQRTNEDNGLAGTGPYKAICLKVLVTKTNKEKAAYPNKVGVWNSNIYFNDPSAMPKLMCVVARIPELHAMLPTPEGYGDDVIIDRYPIFVAQNEDVPEPAPGDLIWVDFGNSETMEHPVYLGVFNKRNFPVSTGEYKRLSDMIDMLNKQIKFLGEGGTAMRNVHHKILPAQGKLALDVSKFQDKINWSKVATENDPVVAYVWAKITEGRTVDDSKAKYNLNGAFNAGIPVGGYHFARPEYNKVEIEIKHFLDKIKEYGFAKSHELILPHMLDLEGDGPSKFVRQNKRGVAGLIDWVNAWMTAVEAETGKTPLLYLNYNDAMEYFGREYKQLVKWPLWIPAYNRTLYSGNEGGPKKTFEDWPWSVWQFGSNGIIKGIPTNVDVNVVKSLD